MDRRTFLGALGAGLAVGYGASAAGRFPASSDLSGVQSPGEPTARRSQPSKKTAQNVIFMVSDGMSAGTLQLADLHISQVQKRRSHWLGLIEYDPTVRRSLVETASFNSLVTDSAAAATAWGLGVLVENGRIGHTPDGRRLAPLLLRAKQAGKAAGLVTTTRLTHATPAGMACNVFDGNRNHEDPIAAQLIERGYDLLLGGGGKFLDTHLQRDGLNALRDAEALHRHLQANASTPWSNRERLIGVFSDSHMAYELDRPVTQPSLSAMTSAAINWLSDAPGGFVLQIEGGRVDHAAHANDAGSLIAEQVAFDEAIGVALEFVHSRDDTLLVLTTDHGNANPGLTDYTRMGIEGFARLEGFRKSFEWIDAQLEDLDPNDTQRLHSVIEMATNISISRRDLELLRRWYSGDAVDPFLLANKNSGPLGSVLANYTKVAFLSPNHTADFVELTALGPGSELFTPTTRLDLTHHALCEALDLPLSTTI